MIQENLSNRQYNTWNEYMYSFKSLYLTFILVKRELRKKLDMKCHVLKKYNMQSNNGKLLYYSYWKVVAQHHELTIVSNIDHWVLTYMSTWLSVHHGFWRLMGTITIRVMDTHSKTSETFLQTLFSLCVNGDKSFVVFILDDK